VLYGYVKPVLAISSDPEYSFLRKPAFLTRTDSRTCYCIVSAGPIHGYNTTSTWITNCGTQQQKDRRDDAALVRCPQDVVASPSPGRE
jgi:hypothetical protein